MADEERTTPLNRLEQLLKALLNSQWLEILVEAWKFVQKLSHGLTEEGMYEVLEYESTLELLDKRGQRARVSKREKVRYLQNNIIAYPDQAWGDGKILLNYRCTPGKPVDRYHPNQKTYILISLREVKNRGDIDEFNIEWEFRKSFLQKTEFWVNEVSHRTRRLKVQVIFPKTRPPLRVLVNDSTNQVLDQPSQVELPDGRWLVSWETDQPRLYERYLLKWYW
jgi:hypothetical protein